MAPMVGGISFLHRGDSHDVPRPQPGPLVLELFGSSPVSFEAAVEDALRSMGAHKDAVTRATVQELGVDVDHGSVRTFVAHVRAIANFDDDQDPA